MPEGLQIAGADYPVVPALPGILKTRSSNRGFEGLTLSQDGSTLYLAIQSPLANPNPKTGNKSRNVRILAFDIASERVTAEYVYRFEPVADFDPTVKPAPEEMKLSGLAPAGPSTLLVLERTDRVAKLYLADLAGATNILGSRWDDPGTNPSLEAVGNPADDRITVLAKSLVVDLSTISEMPGQDRGRRHRRSLDGRRRQRQRLRHRQLRPVREQRRPGDSRARSCSVTLPQPLP